MHLLRRKKEIEMSESYSAYYKFLKNYNLIVYKHIGLIELNRLIHFTNTLCSKEDFSRGKVDFLIDLRTSKFSKDSERVKNFVEFLKDRFSFVLDYKIAFLTDECDQVAMATLFKMFQTKISRNIQIFSTLECALLWFKISVKPREMEAFIHCTRSLDCPELKKR